jgi:sugar transferase (PEP-CTERM system associated)
MIRVFHHYFSGRKLLLFLSETVAIGLSCFAGAVFFSFVLARSYGNAHAPGMGIPRLAILSIAFVCTFQFALYLLDLYDLRIAGEDRNRGMRLLKAVGVAVITMGGVGALVSFQLPGGSLLGGAMGAVAATLLVRARMSSVVGEPARVLVVGRGGKARWLARAIEEHSENAFVICALVDPVLDSDVVPGSVSEHLYDVAKRHGAKYVVSASDEGTGVSGAQSLLLCRLAGLQVFDAAYFCERVLRRVPVNYVLASDLAFSEDLTVPRLRRLVKRCFDLAMSALLIVAAAPLGLLVAIAIKVDSPGPVFYRQERVGRGGRRYVLWKFRSMAEDAEKDGPAWAKIEDDRVTRVGRFIRKARIDEIPQVINVLVGDMSFVGPRPERPVFVERINSVVPFYSLRETVQPGITGWAQIRYQYGASIEDARNKLEFDLYYVKHSSLFLDVAIMFHTIRHVLRGRGAR